MKFLPTGLRALAVLPAVLASALPALAQSSYTANTLGLGAPYKGLSTLPSWVAVDPQDRVVSTLSYYTGLKLTVDLVGNPSSPTPKFSFVPGFANYAVRHVASTAATVTPTKLSTQKNTVALVSPNGQLIYVTNASKMPVNLTGGAALTPDSYAQFRALSDGGVAVGATFRTPVTPVGEVDQYALPAQWTSGQTAQALPVPANYRGGLAIALNSRNDVVGEVDSPGTLMPRAALWQQGQVSLLDTPADQGSYALGISELGHILVATHPYSLEVRMRDSTTQRPISTLTTVGLENYVVLYNGQRYALNCPSNLPQPFVSGISANGLAVGQCVPRQTENTYGFYYGSNATEIHTGVHQFIPGGRAYVWRDGVATELAGLLSSKGVKLATGLVLNHVMGVNANGTLVVVTTDGAGKQGLMRFTAKP